MHKAQPYRKVHNTKDFYGRLEPHTYRAPASHERVRDSPRDAGNTPHTRPAGAPARTPNTMHLPLLTSRSRPNTLSTTK